MVSTVSVSIIYTNWNVRDLMRESIRSLYKYAKDFTYEVIVVDDTSSDGSTEMIREEFPEIHAQRLHPSDSKENYVICY